MILLLCGLVIGFIACMVCYKFDFPKLPTGGKLILDLSNSEEIMYQLIVYDKTGEDIKKMKYVLVEVEVADEVKKNEATSD